MPNVEGRSPKYVTMTEAEFDQILRLVKDVAYIKSILKQKPSFRRKTRATKS